MNRPIQHSNLYKSIKFSLMKIWAAFTGLLPILVIVTFFQFAVIQQPLPQITEILLGIIMVILGLVLFIEGLEIGLFPIGESMAEALAHKGSLFWLLTFAFLLGFSTTIAEPALIAIANEAAEIASNAGLIGDTAEKIRNYALGLRLTVAASVGVAILIGVLRILRGWPIQYLILSGYAIIMLITIVAPKQIIGIAYDAGGVTTSTVTVPLVAALGVGLSKIIRGRSPLLDGFGLIAFASLLPMIFVMLYGMMIFY